MFSQESLVSIIIPSRYQSTRLPGKPLIKIAGVEMLKRVANIAGVVCGGCVGCEYIVATDDERILNFCKSESIPVVLTRSDCASGTERCWDAIASREIKPQLIINMQGDNPLCPPHVIQALIDCWRGNSDVDVFTPSVQLSWEEFDKIIETKKATPYSGTTVLVDNNDFALAFSKAVIPAIRDVGGARRLLSVSPVRRHIGIYAYTVDALWRYVDLPRSDYELGCVEGLEQMRFLANGMRVKVVPVDYRGRRTTSGVDSPEDIARVEEIIASNGDLYTENF
ncbi:MAG: 3-deoxy-manno-octulosonate cytidylyltransferase [Planctomycetaceae bacterium]|jgi:3-deoxy-manno-octulosonate cytidylyltransferase (CMP-KDO synthetase)|nr:3-deoxy-manno-octulosonate cytidylyltransferase [Planctomycetaceae bacterium]